MAGDVSEALERVFLGNSVMDWLIAAGVFAVSLVVLGLVKHLAAVRLAKVAERTSTDVDDLIVDLVRRTKAIFLVALALFLAHHWLVLNERAQTYVAAAIRIATWIQVGLWGIGLVDFGIRRMIHGKAAADPARTMGASILGFVGRALVWGLIFLLCLQALGQPVGTLLASLGVGGIAVALALQNILGDLFASITILLDKPFVIGDSIVLGDFNGTVERIGIKTTRLRSVSGEEIVIGNNDLVSSRVRNFKRMRERRQLFTIGVTYETPADVVARIPGMFREIVSAVPDTRFDRAHFKGFGPSSIDYEVVYFVQTPEYNAMMDVQQRINLEIFRRFEQEKIEFAYPTQKVYQMTVGGSGPAPQKELSRG